MSASVVGTADPREPERLATARGHALAWLRHLIVVGELRPGQRVNQEDLATRIGVSVAPVREALGALEREGQLTYKPRRGYFVTELRIEDLEEIYGLRRLLESRAARAALPELDEEAIELARRAAEECVEAARAEDVAAELAANRRFHMAMLDAPNQPHTLGLIRLLWDSTEPYRALYYNSPAERMRSLEAHGRILDAVVARDAKRLVSELDAHREEALVVLRRLLEAP